MTDHARDLPVLIYAPGLGRFPANSADAVADVIARCADRQRPGHVGTSKNAALLAPRGLTVAKTVTDEDGTALLQLFELDYPRLLEPTTGVAGPAVVPGLARSASYAVLGGWKLLRALGRPAKTAVTKVQLALGLVALLALVAATLVSVYAALAAMGVPIDGDRLGGLFSDRTAKWTFGVSALGLVLTWTSLRRRLLAFAGSIQRLIRFVTNTGAAADTAALSLDDALDGLRDHGYTGPIHVLGFSFGTLVAFETFFPRAGALRAPLPPGGAASLTTVGCPLDLVRLYHPPYVAGRVARQPGLRWINLFNPADLYASTLTDGSDVDAGTITSALEYADPPPESVRYLDERIGLFQVFVSGRTHARYWGEPDHSSCLGPLVDLWIPAAPSPGGG